MLISSELMLQGSGRRIDLRALGVDRIQLAKRVTNSEPFITWNFAKGSTVSADRTWILQTCVTKQNA